MEQLDQSITRSTVESPAGGIPKVSIAQSKNAESSSEKKIDEQRDSIEEISQDHALKALGNVKLSISIDETKELPVIKIFDSQSGKELLQIPAEHSLNISRTIKAAVGAIFDKKA